MAMRWLRLGATCLVAAMVRTASADGIDDEVTTLVSNADAAQAHGDVALALQGYLAAHRLQPRSATAHRIGQAYLALGRWAKAHQYLREALASSDVDTATKAALEGELATVETHVAVLAVRSAVAGATLTLPTGEVLVLPTVIAVAPGDVKLRVEAAGFRSRVVATTALDAGTKREVDVALEAQQGHVTFAGPVGTQVRIDDAAGPVVCTIPCTHTLPVGGYTAYFTPPRGKLPAQDFQLEDAAAVTIDAAAAPVVEIDAELLGFSDDTMAAAKADIAKSQTRQAALRGQLADETLDAASTARLKQELATEVAREAELRELVNLPATTVTAASRDAESIDDAPASVTVISRQELEAFAYPTILESLRGVRGFAVNYDSVYGNASVRGLGQANDYSNRLLVLSDGAALNDDILYQSFIHYDGRVDLGDVERIEIVRGPASVLYGTGAVSGVVNLVMRGREQPNSVHAQVSSVDEATLRVRVGATQHFNADSGMWASVSAARSQGRELQLNGMSIQNVDKFTGFSTAGKAWWKNVSAQWFFNNRDIVVPTGNYGASLNDPNSQYNDQRFLAELKYEPKLSAHSDLMLRAHVNNYRYIDNAVFDQIDDAGEPTGEQYRYSETYRGAWGGVEARLRWTPNKRLKFAIGAEGSLHPRSTMRGEQLDVGASEPVPGIDVSTPNQLAAMSGLVDWQLSSKLRFQGGIRVDYWNSNGDQNAATEELKDASSYLMFSPRAVLIARPREADTVKVMLGRAFRAPSIFEIFYSDAGTTQAPSSFAGTSLKPEYINTAEVEAKHRFNSDWSVLASLHAAVVQNIIEPADVTDEILANHPDVNPSAFYNRNSPDNQTMIGGDVEVRREFRNGAMFSAHYGLLRARYAEPQGGPDATASRQLLNAPTQFAAFKLIVPLVPNRMTGALRAAFEDRRRADLESDARSDRAIVADAVLSGPIKHLGVRYAVGVYNLLNWRYAEPAAPFAAPLMPQQGRTFMFSLTVAK
ncbi:MAG TPA: TonB-dependent receptor [Kofleriaceae bacterium]|nr:TonB-dependent receptor [Kofleriaceae bacterium]